MPKPHREDSLPSTLGYATALTDVDYDDLQPTVIEMTKRLIQDTVAVGVAGRNSAVGERTTSFAAAQYADGPGTILGDNRSLSPVGAALANGALVHAWDFDDTHDLATLHTSATVIPATLAISQYVNGSGTDVITAAALGMETHIRLGLAADLSIWETHWHRTATMGTIGAAVASARLLELSPTATVDAIGLAVSQTAGTVQPIADPAPSKRYQPAHSAMAGVSAALLAADGFEATKDPLFGPHGFLDVYEHGQYDSSELVADLRERPALPSLSIKPYPCCRYVHTTIDAARRIRDRVDVTPSDVERVLVELNSDAYEAVGTPAETVYDPRTSVDLQFNAPYAVLLALTPETPFIDDFTEAAITDTRRTLIDQLSIVETTVSDRFEENYGNEITPSKVTVTTTDGRTATEEVTVPRGHPDNRLSDAAFADKFERCLRYGVEEIDSATVDGVRTRLGALEEANPSSIDDILAKLAV